MKNLLIMQENEFSGTISMNPSTVQPLCTHAGKLVTRNFQICFPAPYLSLHSKYSHMPNMPRGRTSPSLPYWSWCNLATALTLKAPITTAADDTLWGIFPNFEKIRYDIS